MNDDGKCRRLMYSKLVTKFDSSFGKGKMIKIDMIDNRLSLLPPLQVDEMFFDVKIRVTINGT